MPIWLALLLAKKRRCKILMPEWMTEDALEGNSFEGVGWTQYAEFGAQYCRR